ncbi:MAG: HAD family acid phosphatase [Pseudomonadota bacterium]
MHTGLTIRDVHLGDHLIADREGTLICDIDGTIANISHRAVHVMKQPKDWKAFEKNMHLDKPVPHVIEAVTSLHDWGWSVLLCTGRWERSRRDTESWLAEHGVPYHGLHMRPSGDYRIDAEVKSELLDQIISEGHAPTLVFEDRNQVVEMWRARGLTVVQVAHGDF